MGYIDPRNGNYRESGVDDFVSGISGDTFGAWLKNLFKVLGGIAIVGVICLIIALAVTPRSEWPILNGKTSPPSAPQSK